MSHAKMVIPLAIAGVTGRMGRAVLEALKDWPDVTLKAGLCSSESPFLGQELRELCPSAPAGLVAQCTWDTIFQERPVIVDFSTGAHTAQHLLMAKDAHCPIAICSTGQDEQGRRAIEEAAQHIPVLHAPNTSFMAAILDELATQVAHLCPEADAEIMDIHHRYKKDSPSGTALQVGQDVAEARGLNSKNLCLDRHGHRPRNPMDIGVFGLRGGRETAEHTAYFFHDYERLELTHRVFSRSVFAHGALRAARFLWGQPPGLYRMRDVVQMKMFL